MVNRNRNPRVQSVVVLYLILAPWMVANHLKILIPVGMAMIIVAAVKYARVSTSRPTVNMWWAQTIKPTMAIPNMA